MGGDIFISQGHNLFSENGASGVEGATLAASDIVPTVGISAILSPLGDYGGPTQTHLLVPDSPAINAVDNALIPAGVTADQRGFPRIQASRVDIGAVEGGEVATTDIPTLSPWALLLLGLLLVGTVWRTQLGSLGIVYQQEGRLQEALTHYTEALNLADPDPLHYLGQLASLYIELKDYKQADETYKKIDSRCILGHQELALLRRLQGRLPEALD